MIWYRLRLALFTATFVSLSACGGGDAEVSPAVPRADSSDVHITSTAEGNTPFVQFIRLEGTAFADVDRIGYEIAAKPGSSAKPVKVSYSLKRLRDRGHADEGSGAVFLPVFGLYAGHSNLVTLQVVFRDGSRQPLNATLTTVPYVDPNQIYDRPQFMQRRAPGTALGFDFFVLKSYIMPPIVMDTDGEVRWIGPSVPNSFHTVFHENGFTVGEPSSMRIHRMELDGNLSTGRVLGPQTLTKFHHNVTVGKTGLLAMFDAEENGVQNLETIVAEIQPSGALHKLWNMATIIADHMRAHGDDPNEFVRPGIDWFHSNDVIYDPSDDSLIISSRENFVIKIGHGDGGIRWILGDPTKYWYSFPSLRAKALTLSPGTQAPIGQHALSLTAKGDLLLFNNGRASLNAPSGAPIGSDLPYSTSVAYHIDAQAGTAAETWRFDHNQSVLSRYCSSAYQAPDGSSLINYAQANDTNARVLGLDSGQRIVFDLTLSNTPSNGCNTSWNAAIVPFENIVYD